MNLIKESEIMDLPEEQTRAYIKNVTTYSIGHSYFWKLKNLIKEDNTLWVWNFAREGYISEFRKRLFVFENTLTHVRRQYNLELARDRQDQDTMYLKYLVDQMILLNTRITQLMMSSPMLAAIKAAMDPTFRDTVDENGNNIDNINKKEFNRRVGLEIGEGQNIRLENVYRRSNSDNIHAPKGDDNRQGRGTTTTEETGTTASAEDFYRRQKEKGIFFNPN
jgi:hypothetical protein